MKNALRKLGIAGFIFFLVKGLLWLTIPAAVVAFRGCGSEPGPDAAETPAAIVETTKTETGS